MNRQARWRKAHPEVYRENQRRGSRAAAARNQAATSAQAGSHGRDWSEGDVALVLRHDLITRQAALALGRTYYAVVRIRHRYRDEAGRAS